MSDNIRLEVGARNIAGEPPSENRWAPPVPGEKLTPPPAWTTGRPSRIALVTGGSRGIGRATAMRLAAEGAVVAITYRRDEAAADQVVNDIVRLGGRAAAYRASIEDVPAMIEVVGRIKRDFGPIDLLVSNAGTASRGSTVADTEVTEFERLMNVHAFGPVQLMRALLPDMRLAGRADIIVTSSAIAVSAPPRGGAYSMAKAALEAAARTIAWEERDHGIHVNIVAPGLVATDMGGRLVRASEDKEIAALDNEFPFGRVCRPDDVAEVIAFLSSAAAGYLTGQRITVDGGGVSPSIY